jgi:hypothetical protein
MRCAYLAIALICFALAACNGGGGNSIVPSAQTSAAPQKATAKASFTIHVPAKSTSTAARPLYVSPSTAQISIAVNGGTATVSPLNPTATGCTAVSGGFTCQVVVAAPVGSDTFVIELLDANNAMLSSVNVSETIATGTANSFGIVLDGVIASLTVSLASATPPANGEAQQIALTVNGLDADSNIVMGPGNYSAPISITDSDTSGTTSLSVSGSTPGTSVTVTAPGTAVTVNYSGAPLAVGATFTASVPGTSVPMQSVTLTPSSGSSTTTVTLAITGTPAAIAYSTGTGGSWSALPSGATSFTLKGTTAYGVAYMCNTYSGNISFVQATVAEMKTVPIACAQPTLGTLTLTFAYGTNSFCPTPADASVDALEVNVDGQDDQYGGCSSAGTAYPTSLDAVTQDVFATTTTGSNGNVLLAVKTLEGASVPGSATMTFNASDAVGTATIPQLTQVPSTGTSSLEEVYFGSFDNWVIPLLVSSYNASSETTFYTVASSDVGPNDSYLVIGDQDVTGPGTANAVAVDAFSATAPTSVALPTPFNETITAAGLPVFSTTYAWASNPTGNVSGYLFSGSWYGTGIPTLLEGVVTSGFIGSSTTYTMPNIAVSGFPPTLAPSAMEYAWRAEALSVPSSLLDVLPFNGLSPGSVLQGVPISGPSQGTLFIALAQGSFTVP